MILPISARIPSQHIQRWWYYTFPTEENYFYELIEYISEIYDIKRLFNWEKENIH